MIEESNGALEVLNAKQCATVWAAIERRKAHHGLVVPNVFRAIHFGLQFDEVASMTQTDREHAASALIAAIELVRSEVKRLPIVRHFQLKESFVDSMGDEFADNEIARDLYSPARSPSSPEATAALQLLLHKCARSATQRAFWNLGDHLDEVLEGIHHSVDKWMTVRPYVDRPNKPNSRRTYFIRSITACFERYLKAPLREQTLALTSVFFDTSRLSEAEIAKLTRNRK